MSSSAVGGAAMRSNTPRDTGHDRLLTMLHTAMGPVLGALLLDEEVEELAVNEDGRLWEVRHGMRMATGHRVTSQDAERLIRIVADAVNVHNLGPANPSFPAELPGTGYRFQAVVPPQVRAPIFVIRKKPVRIFTLDAYVAQGAMTAAQKQCIEAAVLAKDNLLIVGGTGSGKTTLANAILDVIAQTGERVLTVEDTLELVCHADDKIMMRTVPGVRSIRDCIRDMLRLSPTRIVVGEVRGPEVIDMIAGWNTGHPGGLATIHANSALESLERIEDLYKQGNAIASRRTIARAINVIVFIGSVVEESQQGRRAYRRVQSVLRIDGVDQHDDYLARPIA